MMSQTNKAAKSVITIMAFTLLSKILGFVREMLIGAKFGSGMQTDTFFLAISAISLFTTILTSSIGTTMIPVLSEVEKKEGLEGKIEHTNNILSIVVLLSLVLISFAWILSPYILRIIAPGFESENQFKLAVHLMRVGLPAVLFASIQGVLRGYLQSEWKFTESAAVQFPYNLTYIFYLLILSSTFGIEGLTIAHVVATVSMLSLQIWTLRASGFKYSFHLSFRDVYVNKMFRLIPPILLSVGVSDLNLVISKALGSTLVDGSISALNYATRLDGLVKGLFVTAVVTVLYPMLAREANKEDDTGLKNVTVRGINIILLITIPATIGMMVLATPIVKIAFERGAFDSTATMMTSGALIYTTLGLVGASLATLLNNVYYSMQDTKTPVIIGFISVGVNIVFNYVLVRFMAHRGLALATSISATVLFVLLILGLRGKKGSFGFGSSLSCAIKSLIASLLMGIVISILNRVLPGVLGAGRLMELIGLLVTVMVGVGVYALCIVLFRIKEVEWLMGMIKERFKRN